MSDLFCQTGAFFSECRKYRYSLWRKWDARLGKMMFLMLNPSTADENANDPTVERCQRRAKEIGYGGLVVCNLFAYRATQPEDMKRQADPVGPLNDQTILHEAKFADMVVCGWGEHGSHLGRSDAVVSLLHGAGVTLHCLRTNRSGQPQHPLYVSYNQKPVLYREEAG